MSFHPLRRWLAGACTVALATIATSAGAVTSGMGLNLSEWAYSSTDFPIIDQFKRAGGWYTQCESGKGSCTFGKGDPSPWDTLEQSKMSVDADGWVKSLPAPDDTSVKYRFVSALLFSGNDGKHPEGRYTVLYDGEGTITYGLLGEKLDGESRDNRHVVYVRNGNPDGVLITIRETNPNNYIRNIRVLPPGGVCSGAPKVYVEKLEDCVAQGTGNYIPFERMSAQRKWHPYFQAEVRGFRTLRFLDWGRTNGNKIEHWADRPQMSHAFWNGAYGIPVEAMVDLANTVGADPWINIPAHVDDDYVHRFAQAVKATMSTKSKLIVEYTNEPWNDYFEQGQWLLGKGRTKWPKADPYTARSNWYAMRAVQVCRIVKSEFGADAGRVRCVLNGQAANSNVAKDQLACTLARGIIGQDCAKEVDALAIAPYFGYYISDRTVRDEIHNWITNSNDGGLGKLFEEILGEDVNGNQVTAPLYGKLKGTDPKGAVEMSRTWTMKNFEVATSFRKPLWAYENGQHLTMADGDDKDEAWLALLKAGNRDPRMARAYERAMQNWRAAGGQTNAMFDHIYVPGTYGAWGLKETQFTTTGVKWNAVLPWRDSGCWWSGCGN